MRSNLLQSQTSAAASSFKQPTGGTGAHGNGSQPIQGGNTLKSTDDGRKNSSQNADQFSTQSTMHYYYPQTDSGKDTAGMYSSNNSSKPPGNIYHTGKNAIDYASPSKKEHGELQKKRSERDSKEKFNHNSANTDEFKSGSLNEVIVGNDFSSFSTKKPQFQFVCMEPTKEQRQMIKMHQNTNKDELIDPAILSRILRIQQQQHTQNHASGIPLNILYRQYPQQYSTQDNSAKKITLEIEKIGICGVPSLWMTRDELQNAGHVYRDKMEEQERLERMLKILQSHKKYENDKYFGGYLFKRGGASQATSSTSNNQSGNHLASAQQPSQTNSVAVSNGISIGSSEYVWFSTENLIRLKVTSQNAANQGDKNSNKEENYENLQFQAFPQIRSLDQSDQLSFKILQAEAKLVRLVLESHGFAQTESNDWNILWTCTSSYQKQYIYENLHWYQKVNHFVNASELTRKDRLCYNVVKMQQKFGKSHFDFLPETYILPDEYPEFIKQFQYNKSQQWDDSEPSKNLWIIKPSSSSQGKGIFMIDDIQEVPLNESLVISKYIDNPLLINGLKFDLRLYVLVTNFDPLKIYVYNEGLVRFASEPYNLESIKSNVYAHLTNYSINKKSENFVQNKNIAERDFGNKWSLSALQSHLERLGIDMKAVWARIYDSIIKSIISVENQVVGAIKKVQNVSGGSIKPNCFDLFGFDIILDSDLKPWILEVNLSPSLAFDSPLDFHIKSNLIVDALNIVGIKKVNRKKEAMGKHIPSGSKIAKQAQNAQSAQQSQASTAASSTQNQGDQRKRSNPTNCQLTQNQSQGKLEQVILQEQSKHQVGFSGNIDVSHMERLSKISAKHRELLREHLEEFCMMRQLYSVNGQASPINPKDRRHNFTRIFPAPGTNSYDMYFQGDSTVLQQKQWNKVLYRYLYDKSSELQDILNQVNKQNQLINENQRKASQARINSELASQQLQQQLLQQKTLQKETNEDSLDRDTRNITSTKSNRGELASSSVPPISTDHSKIFLSHQFRSQSSMSNNKPENDASAYNLHSNTMKTIDIKTNIYEGSFSPLNNPDTRKLSAIAAFTHTNDHSRTNLVGDNSSKEARQRLNDVNQHSSTEYFSGGGRVQSNIKTSTAEEIVIERGKSNATISESAFRQASTAIVTPSIQHIVGNDSRIVVTGDDILIEYVRRIMILAKQCHTNHIELSSAIQ